MAAAPVDFAASMILSTARYDCVDGAGPISKASSAMVTNAAWRSASLCTATVRTPRSLQPRMTRSAISPRLATRTFSNMWLLHVDQRVASAHHIALLHVHVRHGHRQRRRFGLGGRVALIAGGAGLDELHTAVAHGFVHLVAKTLGDALAAHEREVFAGEQDVGHHRVCARAVDALAGQLATGRGHG